VLGSAIKTVMLARHGETEWNRLRRRQGQLDSPLTERGLVQARAVADGAVGLSMDSIFASPLPRAATTAALCAERTGLSVTVIVELSEINHGRMAGLTTEDIERFFPGELDRRAEDKYRWRFPGGESYADADRRAGIALERISTAGVRRPLIVSHEMIGRMLLRHLLGVDPVTALGWRHPHDVIYQVAVGKREVTEIRVESRVQ
jgi:broad specificity phosphatase PhoE